MASRIAGLQALDARLASLEQHLGRTTSRSLAVVDLGGPCCDAADAVLGSAGWRLRLLFGYRGELSFRLGSIARPSAP